MKKVFDKMTGGSVKLVEKYLPDPYIFAIILTFFVFIVAMIVTANTPINVIEAWYGGFWSLLAFAMQMALILVTGTILATAPPFKKGLGKLASLLRIRFKQSSSSALSVYLHHSSTGALVLSLVRSSLKKLQSVLRVWIILY
jgi:short subunit fatty acids transporter